MPVAFGHIPANTLLPLFYAEVSAAPQPVAANLKVLLIGHMNKSYSEGTAVAGVFYLLSDDLATTLFGRGSQLQAMYRRARTNAPFTEIWAIAIPEEVGSANTRAEGDIVVRAAPNATRSGLLNFWIAGKPCQILVDSDDTTHEVAVKINKAINSQPYPVQAYAVPNPPDPDASKVHLACKWEGVTGNAIRISSTGPRGRATTNSSGAVLARALLTLPQMLGGAGEWETHGETLAAIGDEPFDVIVFPFTDGTSMAEVKKFMSNETGRWSPHKALYGHAVTARVAPYADMMTWAEPHNDPHVSVLGIQQTVVPPWEWAASLGAVMSVHWAAPPELSRPLQTLPLEGMYIGAEDAESYDRAERNILLGMGVSTFDVDPDGGVRIDRVRTLRKTNAFGDPDAAWADAITMFQTQFFVRSMRAHIQSTFPRCALTNVPTGINGFTSVPQIAMAILHNYRLLEAAGLVENFGLFSQYLVVERDLFDRNRVNVLMRPDMVNQLRVVAALVETHLQIDVGSLDAVAA